MYQVSFYCLVHHKNNRMVQELPISQIENGTTNTTLEERHTQMPYFLSMQQSADFLHLKISTFQKISAKRLIPVYKPRNGKVYFKQQDLIDYIESGRQKSVFELEAETLQSLARPRNREDFKKRLYIA